MATFKHISSKNADYGAAEQYLTFEHDEFTMKPTLDGNGRLVLRDDYRISSLNCGDEDFVIACMRSNLKYGKNQKRDAKCNQEEFEKSGTNGKCIEARELMIALPESFINYDHDHLLKKMVDEFKKRRLWGLKRRRLQKK